MEIVNFVGCLLERLLLSLLVLIGVIIIERSKLWIRVLVGKQAGDDWFYDLTID